MTQSAVCHDWNELYSPRLEHIICFAHGLFWSSLINVTGRPALVVSQGDGVLWLRAHVRLQRSCDNGHIGAIAILVQVFYAGA